MTRRNELDLLGGLEGLCAKLGTNMGLVDQIRQEIERQGRSRAEVARAAGIHEVQVRSMFHKGAPLPAGRNAEKLAKALGCRWVLVRREVPIPPS